MEKLESKVQTLFSSPHPGKFYKAGVILKFSAKIHSFSSDDCVTSPHSHFSSSLFFWWLSPLIITFSHYFPLVKFAFIRHLKILKHQQIFLAGHVNNGNNYDCYWPNIHTFYMFYFTVFILLSDSGSLTLVISFIWEEHQVPGAFNM